MASGAEYLSIMDYHAFIDAMRRESFPPLWNLVSVPIISVTWKYFISQMKYYSYDSFMVGCIRFIDNIAAIPGTRVKGDALG